MARGNEIIVTSDPKGQFDSFYLTTAMKPGTIVQRDPSVALKSGRFTAKLYDADADGGRPKGALWVVTQLHHAMTWMTATDEIPVGELAKCYCPRAGEEINLLLANLSGTADDHTAGEILIVDDTTGLLIATTGSPETEVAMLLETVTDPTADQLVWCEWTGY